jgi:signal transduction histidine kinase
VQLHRGHISADSKKGEWAQFCVEIPATLECPLPSTTSTGDTP